jgi:hypothetical protein
MSSTMGREISISSAGNRTPIPWPSSPEPSGCTDRAIPAPLTPFLLYIYQNTKISYPNIVSAILIAIDWGGTL